MSPRAWAAAALAAILGLLLLGRWVAGAYVDYQWYASMGAPAARLWAAKAFNGTLLTGVGWVVGTLFAFANLYGVRRSIASLVLPRRVSNLEIGEEVPPRHLTLAAFLLAALVGALLTFSRGDWTLLAYARYAAPFRETDTAFGRDLSFWVTWLPLEQALYARALTALLLVAALVLFLYAITTSLSWEQGALRVTRHVRRHLTVLGALLVALLGWSYRLDGFEALVDGSGPELAFAWVDYAVVVPASQALVAVCLLVAPLVAWAGWRGFNRVSLVAVTVVLVMSLLLRQLLPAVASRTGTAAERTQRERPYEASRALSSIRAYGVDRVRRTEADAGGMLGHATLASAARGLSLWEPVLLARAMERVRDLGDVSPSLGWEATPAGLVASGIERGEEAAGAERPWTVVRALAGAADPGGNPVLLDVPGAPIAGTLTLPPPLVYDSAQGYAVVSDPSLRVPAPHVGSTRSRLAHAWSEQNLRLLFGDLPRPNPRIVLRRDVRERVGALAPFFEQGRTVAPLVANDSLFWVLELYSASATYPLSLHQVIDGREWTYFQHAATALIEAQTGRVTLVADSAAPPAARVWLDRFPGLFTSVDRLSRHVTDLLPPPYEGAMARARAVARYGMRSFTWEGGHLPTLDGSDTTAARGEPAPISIDLPRTGHVTARSIPVLDEAGRVRGALLATGGASRDTWWLPLSRPTVRWDEVLAQLQGAPDGAALAPRNVRQVAGRTRVVPTRWGALYAQAVYTFARDGAPTLLRVGVTTGLPRDSVRFGRTFAAATGVEPARLDSMPPPPATPAQFRARVEQLYDAMRGALRRGDWTAFGRAYDELGMLLGRSTARGAPGESVGPSLPLEPATPGAGARRVP